MCDERTIRAGKIEAINQSMQTSISNGRQTMDQSLLQLYREGEIDHDIAKSYVYDKTTGQKTEHDLRPKSQRQQEPHFTLFAVG